MGGATWGGIPSGLTQNVFLTTLPMRGATEKAITKKPNAHISIHAPHAGSDYARQQPNLNTIKFLSTLPMRGATRLDHLANHGLDFYPRSPCGERHPCAGAARRWMHFYPRSPCGERRVGLVGVTLNAVISIHAPHAGSDDNPPSRRRVEGRFLSTRPMRGATIRQKPDGSDAGDFYPRSPCGERR